jgi:hypothetical protein
MEKECELKIFEMGYKRTENLGNYESHSLELKCQMDEDDNVDDVLFALLKKVRKGLKKARGQRNE